VGAKFLVGAIVGAFSVCGGVWMLSGRSSESVALAAPARAEERRDTHTEALEIPRETRFSALEPESAPPLEPATIESRTPRELARLVEDLRDDEIKGNAGRAVEALRVAGPEALEPLQRALRSNDFQQRQLAGVVLAGRKDAPATQPFADVLVEGLGDDDPDAPVHGSIDIYTGFDLQTCCREVLSTRPALFALALPRLAPLVDAPNDWLRFNVARVFAAQRSEVAREPVLATLIGHLADNLDSRDGRISLRAIAGFGADALPALERTWPGQDDQQRALLGHLIWVCAPQHSCARELKPDGFYALGFARWNPLPLEEPAVAE